MATIAPTEASIFKIITPKPPKKSSSSSYAIFFVSCSMLNV